MPQQDIIAVDIAATERNFALQRHLLDVKVAVDCNCSIILLVPLLLLRLVSWNPYTLNPEPLNPKP